MKGLHLALRFAEFGRRSEALAKGLSIDLAGQTEIGSMTWLARLVTVTVWFTTTALNGCDGSTAEIAQLQDLRQDGGTLLLEARDGIRQRAPPNVSIR